MVLCSKTPIDQLVEYSINIIHATVLVIKVVGMLPHVDSQKRFYSLGQWQIRVACFDHFELVAILHQPCPATTKLSCRRRRQLFFASIHGIEGRLDFLLQLCRRIAPTFWRQAIPVECVVPDLCSIIENPNLVRLPGHCDNNLLQRQIRKLRTGYEFVEIVDISLMMLAVVKA